MVSHKTIIKFSIITLLSFLMMANSSFGYNLQEPIPHLEGIKGENSWYISDVIVDFSYDPKFVSEIQYFLEDEWHIYEGPFTVKDDGFYLINWIWFDMYGFQNGGKDIVFKIDQTLPTMEISRKSSLKNKVIFTAVTDDEVSKIERVEFYLDDVLQLTVKFLPYQYTWQGEDKHIVYAISYNYAGLFEKSDNLTTTPKPLFRNHYFMNIVIMLLQKIFIRFY